jgi:hypothetical protein
MSIIARSRIGFWTAFVHLDEPHLNARAADGGTVTIRLDAEDVSRLTDPRFAHAHARALVERGPRVDPALPTPPRGDDEPAPYDWEPARPDARLDRAA